MPKTPRRSLRSYLRSAPVIVIPFRDTEILAELECHQPAPTPRATGYKLGKPAPKPPSAAQKACDWCLRTVERTFVVALVAVAAAVGLVLIAPK